MNSQYVYHAYDNTKLDKTPLTILVEGVLLSLTS